MWFKSMLIAVLCVAVLCKEEGVIFHAVKAWGVPNNSTSIPNCYKVRIIPIKVENFHRMCKCRDEAAITGLSDSPMGLKLFGFIPREGLPWLSRILATNVIRDSSMIRRALTSDCKCMVLTTDAAVPVLRPYPMNKDRNCYVHYQLIQTVQMLGQINMPDDIKDLPIMRVLYCDNLLTSKEVEEATAAVMLQEGVDQGKLICDLVK